MWITEGRTETDLELNESAKIFFKRFHCECFRNYGFDPIDHNFEKMNSPYWVSTHSPVNRSDDIPKHKIQGYFTPHFKCSHCGIVLIHLGDGQFRIGNPGAGW